MLWWVEVAVMDVFWVEALGPVDQTEVSITQGDNQRWHNTCCQSNRKAINGCLSA